MGTRRKRTHVRPDGQGRGSDPVASESQDLTVGGEHGVATFARHVRDAVARALALPAGRTFDFIDKSEWPVVALKIADQWRIKARDSRERTVLPLRHYDLWVSTEILLSSRLSVFHLCSTSLRVFSGAAVDELKEPLFRAEWDFAQKSAEHAQPHWQVYDSDEARRSMDLTDPDSSGDVAVSAAEGPGSRRRKLGRFHFAMAARWHVDNACVMKLERANDLPAWVARCLGYIRQELHD